MKKKLLVQALVIIMVLCVSNVFAIVIMVKGNPDEFVDIKGHWAESSIRYGIENGYFKGGNEKNHFEPDVNMSRAMLVTTLWRLTGDDLTYTKVVNGETKKYPKYVNMFWDMKDDDWCTNYIAWANKNDIINGYSKREFGPNDNVTREQLAVIIYNYLKNYRNVRVMDSLKVTDEVSFTDEAMISSWAKDKVMFIAKTNLLQGNPDGSFMPQAPVTRAEVSVLVERLVKMFSPSV